MIIIENKSELNSWVREELTEEIGILKLDLTTYEVAQGISQDIVLIEVNELNKANKEVRQKLESCLAVIVFNSNNEPVIDDLSNIILEISKETNMKQFSKLVKKFERFITEQQYLKSDLLALDRELSNVYHSLNEELHRVKDTYEKKYPRRFEEIKGIKLFGKYAAGINMGTDYYDVITKEENMFGIICSSNSYLLSNSIVNCFQDLREHSEINSKNEKEFIQNLLDEAEKLKKQKVIELDILTFRVNFSTLDLTINSTGSFGIIKSGDEQFLLPKTESKIYTKKLKLDRGERILLNSTGLYLNNLEEIPVSKIEELISNSKIKSLDILDEIYFQLKKNSEDGIIQYDSSSLIIEVNPNVMVSV